MATKRKITRGTIKFSMALVILAGLFVLCIFKPSDVVASNNIRYIKNESDIGFSRLIWDDNNYIVDDNTGIIYKENNDLSIALYFTDETEDYVYKYNTEMNYIEKLELH